jgi:cold shock CspA family protein
MDAHLVDKRLDFYDMLRTEYHYEVELFEINYKGRRVRKEDRQPGDEFVPQEKCVDIALSAHAMYNAAIPDAYDIAVCVVGDRDFIPMLQLVRRLGKRVAVASIKGSCASEYADPADRSRVRDFDLIWLDDHIGQLELKARRRQVECQSPHHEGDRLVETDELVRKGRPYYCKSCREKYKRGHAEAAAAFEEAQERYGEGLAAAAAPQPGESLPGKVKFVNDKGWGFIERPEGDYFFHVSDLTDEDIWPFLDSGTDVVFQVVRRPDPANRDRPSGQATRVARTTAPGEPADSEGFGI